ncbi:MAG: hypothetical protein II991_02870 [Bacteroidales bacterium]|nr:hypothetical protein [Bacteroidales bacterium]
MKKTIKSLSAVILAFAAAACSSPEKMTEMAQDLTVGCEPAVLEVVGGKIDADVTVTYPADYFHPKAILEVTPVIVYEGGEVKMEPFMFQGEKVKDNYQVIPAGGSTITKKVSFDYAPGMEKCYLELRGTVKYNTASTTLPSKKVADGANTTYMLVSKKGVVDYKTDDYKEVIAQKAEGQILYNINSAEVRNNQMDSKSIKDFQAAIEAIQSNDRMSIVSTDVVAYASPDGEEDKNAELSDNRSKSAEKAFGAVTKKHAVNAPVNVKSVAEDWEGFQELVAASDMEDKDLIIRVLSMYSDPTVREKEIRNLSAVYQTLAQEVLPELRRARFIANVEFTNYTSEELLELIDSNIDILDEEALLRAASLVEDNDDKLAIYRKAVDKFDSQRAQYNIAVTYINMDEIGRAKNALSKVGEDSDVYNALGVIALREDDINAAAEYFAIANSKAGVENAAIIDIIDGEYEAAAEKLAGKKTFNAALVQLLTGNNGPAAAYDKDCPQSAYLRAVAAARIGDSAVAKAELEKASKDEELAQRAAKDVEFAQFR